MIRLSRKNWIPITLVFTAIIGGWWSYHFRHHEGGVGKSSAAHQPNGEPTFRGEKSALGSGERGVPSDPVSSKESWTVGDGADRVSIVLALDEANIRNGDGLEHWVQLEPPATVATLSERLLEIQGNGKAYPIAYPAGEERSEENRLIVTQDLRVQLEGNTAEQVAVNHRLKVTEHLDYAPGWVLMAAADPVTALETVAGVRRSASVVSADVLLASQMDRRSAPNDPLYSQQWHLKKTDETAEGTDVDIEDVWQFGGQGGVRGSGIRIGIVDDGLQVNHPDFIGGVDTANDYDFNGQDQDPSPSSYDPHGTACAGVAAGRGNNGLGGIGAAPMATLVGYRLIAGDPTDAQIAAALNYKSDLVQVKSNSWGPSDGGNRLGSTGVLTRSALQNATKTGRDGKGTIFVWAGGNGGDVGDNSNYDAYANSIYTIAVGATNSEGTNSYYSEPGSNLIVSAPSSGLVRGITTTDLVGPDGYNTSSSADGGDYTDSFGGTSSATPLVSGIIALMLEKNPDLGWRDVQEILIRSAYQIDPTDSDWMTNAAGLHFNHKYGAGRVDAGAAVALAADWTDVAQQVSTTVTKSSLDASLANGGSEGITEEFEVTDAEMTAEQVTLTVDIVHPSRGALEIRLTSPSGTVSRLAEVHDDTNANYPSWTFSTVRNWGEDPNGIWTLKVVDTSSNAAALGGVLNSAKLVVYGASTAPPNPAPVVTIDNLESGAVYGSGPPIDVLVTATDLDAMGNTGTVSKVTLLDNGEEVASDTSAPYSFQLTPTDGTHVLEAHAFDSEGIEGSSPQIVLGFGNQAPEILDAQLSQEAQCYEDEILAVTNLTSSDYENADLVIHYQWQSSTDQIAFTDAAGETSATLSMSSMVSGKIWRCVMTAFDGEKTSEPFVTQGVNVLARPVLHADPGDSYEYTSGLVLRGSAKPLSRMAIINEFSQGVTGGNSEWVEILMLQSGSLSGWRLTGAGGTSVLDFVSGGVWDNIPAGTLITIYNGSSTSGKDPLIPADDGDPGDFQMVVSSTSKTYFTQGSSSWIFLSDSGGAVILKNSDLLVVDNLSYGNNSSGTMVLPAVASGKAAYFTGENEESVGNTSFWTVTSAQVSPTPATPLVGVTPGLANCPTNATFVSQLQQGEYVNPSIFRLGDGVVLPEGLSFDSETGIISGTIAEEATNGSYYMVIERYNDDGAVTSQTFDLVVGTLSGFESWVTGYGTLPDSSLTGDSDGDGLPNLIEYLLGLDPTIPDAKSGITLETNNEKVALVTQQTSRTDYQLSAEWSVSLDASAVWSAAGIEVESSSAENGTFEVRYSLPIQAEYPKRFMRLVATPIANE
ncbi:S8 family serine peptidase [Luteolibacter pohnpeiensis]|uniref:S8 family serine peptidase n=1 Tax=Luteolibacter pohnpeiensis TaxID=454153 RepID=A0A934VXI8_9BACT|nr:S8 family serine peptidase [Luteolibacter pohnpeiensis]MBK1883549.1 S8 family serine peptidase [Luteolibacter pohnpeiensis]